MKPTIEKLYGGNMMLFTSYLGEGETFKMLPVSDDCPYVEALYDPNLETLVVISKVFKESLHNVPKMDDNGDIQMRKTPGRSGKPFKEQRIKMETYQEYYLINKEEQIEFVKAFAVNSESFDYGKFMEKKTDVYQPEKSPLVDAAGAPISK
jgi:hypothetical protein